MAKPLEPGFLAHREGDVVGVAVRDLEPGPAEGGYLHGTATRTVELLEEIPLGHKVALVEIAAGDPVIEYGQRVGTATADIPTGALVHVHNVRSARWHSSVA